MKSAVRRSRKSDFNQGGPLQESAPGSRWRHIFRIQISIREVLGNFEALASVLKGVRFRTADYVSEQQKRGFEGLNTGLVVLLSMSYEWLSLRHKTCQFFTVPQVLGIGNKK